MNQEWNYYLKIKFNQKWKKVQKISKFLNNLSMVKKMIFLKEKVLNKDKIKNIWKCIWNFKNLEVKKPAQLIIKKKKNKLQEKKISYQKINKLRNIYYKINQII